MTRITVPEREHIAQARVPTPVEISIAINTVLVEDARDPQTPHVPAHVGGLMRRAIERANAGEFK